MSTIYVRTTGNDGTGTGLTGAPYLTVDKALSVAVAGDTILIGTGTYAETSGSGYLNVNKSFASLTTITTETGLQDVTIKGTGTAQAVIWSNNTNQWWHNITFEAQAATCSYACRITGAMAGMTFTRCVFRAFSSVSQTNQCFATTVTTGVASFTGVVFDNCTFEQIGHYSVGGLQFDPGTAASGTYAGVEVYNCIFRTSYFSFRMYGGDVQFHDNYCDTWSVSVGASCAHFGQDAATGQTLTGAATGNVFRTHTGHGCIVGGGSSGFVFRGNKIRGGNNSSAGQGLVIKNSLNSLIEGNEVRGGYLSGLYLKAASGCTVVDNSVLNTFAGSSGLRCGINSEDNSKVTNCIVRRNRIHASAGTAISWDSSSGDGGGNTCDENVVSISGSATYGTVKGSSVTTLATLQSAWSGYDQPGNDRNTRLGLSSVRCLGSRIVELA